MNKQELGVGDQAPPFDAVDTTGRRVSSKEWAGKNVVLYFYPKDDTPGCTKEACAFRDELPSLTQLGALVVGVSPDDAASHQRFVSKYQLNFTLLADEERKLCNLFGVSKKLFGIERTTFLINSKGRIAWIEKPVTVAGHVERVTEALRSLVE